MKNNKIDKLKLGLADAILLQKSAEMSNTGWGILSNLYTENKKEKCPVEATWLCQG